MMQAAAAAALEEILGSEAKEEAIFSLGYSCSGAELAALLSNVIVAKRLRGV